MAGEVAKGQFLKQVQQSVLHLLRVGIGQLSQPKTEVALQAWQYTAQLYWKINAERRDQAVPGIHREPDGEVLFSREDVQQQRVDQGVQRLSVLNNKRGVSSFHSPAGHSFRFTGAVQYKGSKGLYKGKGKYNKGLGRPFGYKGKGGRGKSYARSSYSSYNNPGQGVPSATKGYGSRQRGMVPSSIPVTKFKLTKCSRMQGHSPLSVTSKLHSLVGETCPRSNYRFDKVWGRKEFYSINFTLA